MVDGRRLITIAEIQVEVCREFVVDPRHMVSTSRLRAVARPRQVAMYLARKLTHHSLEEVGWQFGNRDHTTVMHAVRQITGLMEYYPEFALRVTALEDRIRAPELVEHY